ncbi:MAG: hypothetical protein R3B54_07915 [Bdellovibrionota bacterium]
MFPSKRPFTMWRRAAIEIPFLRNFAVYSTLNTPDSVYDYDMATRTQVLAAADRDSGGFDAGVPRQA